jgi:hypothetical protein
MLLEHHGIHVPDDWLRDVAGVHRITVARWRAAQRLPRAVSLLIRVMHHGELELVHPAWRDHRLDRRDGTLWTPESWPCRPEDLAAIKYRIAQVRELERALARSLPLTGDCTRPSARTRRREPAPPSGRELQHAPHARSLADARDVLFSDR